ncbi:MAG: transcription termination/antitermination protein NusA [Firmicutes bacterium]|nr:transcription termination/antitermination protein NusA [Bacillota bacterium]
MNLDVMRALTELEKERGIGKDVILEAIEAAITSAYKRNYGTSQNVRVKINDQTGRINVYTRKVVVEDVGDETAEISLAEAQAIDPNYVLDDVVEIEVTPADFGRIAAQTAKQVVIQRIREAERAIVYDEFSNRQGDVITGIVQRYDHRSIIVDLGKVEAVLSASDQMPGDAYTQRTRLKVYISEVKENSKGPQVFVSRTHPGLVSRLFEMEVPEIHDGIVEIRAVAREAGARSKIAVSSRDENVDPVGACVGPRGMRVQAVVSELRGEKIDIIPWANAQEEFVGNALSPAKVVDVFLDEETKTAQVVVPDNHLSLAIGKEGQNARLAARLTGWRIDIKSQEQMAQIMAKEAFERATPKISEIETADETDDEQVNEEVESKAQLQQDTSDDMENADAPLPIAPLEEEDEKLDAPDGANDAQMEESGKGETLVSDQSGEEQSEWLDKPVAAAVKPKSRKTRKQEIEAMLEEELVDAEPLPTLFAGKKTDPKAIESYVAGPKSGEKDGQQTKENPITTKKVIKDLSDLGAIDFDFDE